ncbi:autotransporter assembly complex protein TamA [Sneathiella limimaris]|uniref:autotransporter assembly complex protein TamA n=1 Tax=Sneathiella limimaris TaxID=1964213 RepID=UPI00146BFF16|nr:autotransporter assembly complex family protein [Sneathiella limimaris]
MDSKPLAAAEASKESDVELAWDYQLLFEGEISENLKDLMEQSSRLVQLQDKPPSSLAGLKRRVQEDEENFQKALRSEGYYASIIETRLDQAEDPTRVYFKVEVGPQYKIANFQIKYQILQRSPPALDLTRLAAQKGLPARSETIVAAQKQAIAQLAELGFPNAKILKQEAVVDFKRSEMDAVLIIEPGPYIQLGKLQLEGLSEVNVEHMRRLSGWVENVTYQKSTLEQLRRVYLDTGLFEAVRYQIPPNITQDASVPVTFIFKERKHRSIGVGVEYSSSEGAGTNFYWEHRNFYGQGEKLRADLQVSEVTQELSARFLKPNVYMRHQSLKAEAHVKHENTDAYTEDSARVYLGLDRRWGKYWTLGGGLFWEYSSVEENNDIDDFVYLGTPLTAAFDNTDNILDPSKGYRFGVTVTPHLGLNAVSSNFLTTELHGSTYYSVLDEKRLILAMRGKIGSLLGDSTADIPAVKRFYSGGGGSVRGYEFQLVGPLDVNNDPSGGRSIVEVGLEARIKITDTIGIVPFIEGGNVYEDMNPDLSEDFQWAAGLGGRYYTPFGPLRFDVAIPLNPRTGIDDDFQFYISIGQAF